MIVAKIKWNGELNDRSGQGENCIAKAYNVEEH